MLLDGGGDDDDEEASISLEDRSWEAIFRPCARFLLLCFNLAKHPTWYQVAPLLFIRFLLPAVRVFPDKNGSFA